VTILAGIDPGLSGAVAFFNTERNDVEVFDIPTFSLTRSGKNKREVDAHALARILSARRIDHAFVERVGAMPGQGVSGVFAFGKCYGIILGVLAAIGAPQTLVAPQTWKKALQVPAAKDGARARASELMPQASHQWARGKDDGRSEAALIALYAHHQLNGNSK